MFKRLSLPFLLFGLLCISPMGLTKTIVKVGGYPFAPYVTKSADGRYSGLTLDIINQLNQIQDKYQFTFVSTSSPYRYQAFSRNRFELMFFENKMWGWQHADFYTLPLPIDDGEVYIAKHDPADPTDYFADIASKKLVLVEGYHYNITNDLTDKATLKKKFDVTFVTNNHASIEAILRGRGEVAPVTWSYLQHYFRENPQAKERIISSERWDQRYQHQVLLSHKAAISHDELLFLLQELDKKGVLDELATNYQLSRKVSYR
ncbi:substrate-binding periplasmic protein [Motilimonas eburnea]|uniref:substrate-binding periplasmic protein n=1 Tax=Motilimonas eburnea TaxID=1737488 RepID=UPI001E3EC69D|nr:transporter substrate-binding domain-containing protein [Motilimonas eburnea]MCE2573109.1 transporter substrate-binding domain-containing protein [Motilimonas eburnea]